jgi:hypothetical protein
VGNLIVLLFSRLGRTRSLQAKIESTVLAMQLVAGTIWYYYAYCELGSTRAASFLVAYRPVGAETRIDHERVQAAKNTEYGSTIHDIFRREQPPPLRKLFHVPNQGSGLRVVGSVPLHGLRSFP